MQDMHNSALVPGTHYTVRISMMKQICTWIVIQIIKFLSDQLVISYDLLNIVENAMKNGSFAIPFLL